LHLQGDGAAPAEVDACKDDHHAYHHGERRLCQRVQWRGDDEIQQSYA
jgi:hypothetical protein